MIIDEHINYVLLGIYIGYIYNYYFFNLVNSKWL